MTTSENSSASTLPQENQHTPGPWEWNESATVTANGVLGSVCVAEVYNSQWQHIPSQRTREANARLIAAAPDLLNALQAIHNGFVDRSIQWTKKRQSDSDPYHPANVLMCAAFEKVRGDAEPSETANLTPLQAAILLLCKDLNISVKADGDGDATFTFHGEITVDFSVFGELREKKLVETGYRTGRICPFNKGGAR